MLSSCLCNQPLHFLCTCTGRHSMVDKRDFILCLPPDINIIQVMSQLMNVNIILAGCSAVSSVVCNAVDLQDEQSPQEHATAPVVIFCSHWPLHDCRVAAMEPWAPFQAADAQLTCSWSIFVCCLFNIWPRALLAAQLLAQIARAGAAKQFINQQRWAGGVSNAGPPKRRQTRQKE